jgi:RNA recognition motif-containing protein
MSSHKNPQVYVGRLPRRTRADDLEREFSRFGQIKDIVVKSGYGFIVIKTEFLFPLPLIYFCRVMKIIEMLKTPFMKWITEVLMEKELWYNQLVDMILSLP